MAARKGREFEVYCNEALQKGAAVGGGAELKQAVRKFGQAMGADIPETASTDELQALLTDALARKAKTFGANPTNVEDQYVRSLVGTITTDPTALPKLIAYTTAQAHKSLQDFGDFVKIKRENWATQPLSKTYPGLYDTADVGLQNGPSKLFGPQDFQMTVMKALQQAGGDPSRFADPSGKPFAKDANFSDISMSPIGKAGAAPTTAAPGTAQNPLKLDQLTPEQKAQLRQILGQ